jgi:hypothetical protein
MKIMNIHISNKWVLKISEKIILIFIEQVGSPIKLSLLLLSLVSIVFSIYFVLLVLI